MGVYIVNGMAIFLLIDQVVKEVCCSVTGIVPFNANTDELKDFNLFKDLSTIFTNEKKTYFAES